MEYPLLYQVMHNSHGSQLMPYISAVCLVSVAGIETNNLTHCWCWCSYEGNDGDI